MQSSSTMKLLLILSLIGLAVAELSDRKQPRHYHEAVGIKTAARIKASEEAVDFSGSRVVGGGPSPIGAHPYLAGLIITLQSMQQSVCSGALVTHTRVVTAAHCNFDGAQFAQTYTVVLGSETLFAGGWRLTASSVIQHPAWNWNTMENDVALLVIPWIGYSFWVSNIDLPIGALMGMDFAGMYAQLSGFGVSSGAGGNVQPGQVQNQVWLRVISNTECGDAHDTDTPDEENPDTDNPDTENPDDNLVQVVTMTEADAGGSISNGALRTVTLSTLCTEGSTTQGPCNGDNGGPLSVVTGGRPVLIGISSYLPTTEDCVDGLPAAFTRVTYHSFWIEGNF